MTYKSHGVAGGPEGKKTGEGAGMGAVEELAAAQV